jgi:hypothetical protein
MSVFVGCNGWVLFSTCLNVLVQCTAECVIVVFFLHTSQAMDHLMHAELCDPWTECAGEELRGACCKIRRWESYSQTNKLGRFPVVSESN